jgi:hypothetical protein
MAEPIVRSFQIDTGSSEQKLDALGSGLDNVENSSKSLRAQLKELQAQLANTDPQTDKYVKLSQAASELKDKIGDAAEAIGTQAGSAFERVGNSLGLVTGRLLNLDFTGAAEGAKLFAKNANDLKTLVGMFDYVFLQNQNFPIKLGNEFYFMTCLTRLKSMLKLKNVLDSPDLRRTKQ